MIWLIAIYSWRQLISERLGYVSPFGCVLTGGTVTFMSLPALNGAVSFKYWLVLLKS